MLCLSKDKSCKISEGSSSSHLLFTDVEIEAHTGEVTVLSHSVVDGRAETMTQVSLMYELILKHSNVVQQT